MTQPKTDLAYLRSEKAKAEQQLRYYKHREKFLEHQIPELTRGSPPGPRAPLGPHGPFCSPGPRCGGPFSGPGPLGVPGPRGPLGGPGRRQRMMCKHDAKLSQSRQDRSSVEVKRLRKSIL